MDKKNDNYDEYADAKRSGRLKEKAPEPESYPEIPPELKAEHEPMGISKWIYRALIAAAIGFITWKGSQLLDKGKAKQDVVVDKVDNKIPKVDKTIAEICADRPPVIRYIPKDCKPEIKWRNSPPVIEYVKDLKCQQDLTRLKSDLELKKYWIHKFNTSQPFKGEVWRKLTIDGKTIVLDRTRQPLYPRP